MIPDAAHNGGVLFDFALYSIPYATASYMLHSFESCRSHLGPLRRSIELSARLYYPTLGKLGYLDRPPDCSIHFLDASGKHEFSVDPSFTGSLGPQCRLIEHSVSPSYLTLDKLGYFDRPPDPLIQLIIASGKHEFSVDPSFTGSLGPHC